MNGGFRHSEDGRTIIFGPGVAAGVADLVEPGFVLLTGARGRDMLPGLADRAGAVVDVPAGLVEDVAAALRARVTGTHLVTVGGGRIVDVAKALAAADPPRTVTAVPTTLSGAELTGGHRHAAGVAPGTPRVRPHLVVNDPHLSASAPVPALAASSANALGHAVTAFAAADGDPAPRARAFEATARIARAWSGADPDRHALALGALLAGWALGDTGIGPHHVLSQTLVRTAGLGHAQANSLILPVSIGALRRTHPSAVAALETGVDADLTALAVALRERAAAKVEAAWRDGPGLDRAVDAALARPELGRVLRAPTRDEIAALFRTAAGQTAPDAR